MNSVYYIKANKIKVKNNFSFKMRNIWATFCDYVGFRNSSDI